MTLNEQYSVFRLRANIFRQGLQSRFYVSRGRILKKKTIENKNFTFFFDLEKTVFGL